MPLSDLNIFKQTWWLAQLNDVTAKFLTTSGIEIIDISDKIGGVQFPKLFSLTPLTKKSTLSSANF